MEVRVQGYPTIKAYAGGRLVDYNGDRSAVGLKNWAMSLVPNKVTVLKNKAALDSLLARASPGSGKKAVKDKAAWNAAVLLFTDKKETAPMFKSLSAQFAGKIAFGEVRESARDLVDLFGVTKFPTLIAVCNGDPAAKEVYSGKLKSEPIASFLSKFAGGKKCDGMVKLDAKTDLSKLKVSQLKSLLKERGVVCGECAEKADFVARLKSLL